MTARRAAAGRSTLDRSTTARKVCGQSQEVGQGSARRNGSVRTLGRTRIEQLSPEEVEATARPWPPAESRHSILTIDPSIGALIKFASTVPISWKTECRDRWE